MSILHATHAPVKFDSRRPARNATFGVGVFPQRGRKLPIGPTPADRAWAAENLNHDGITDDEADRLDARAMPAVTYRELAAEVGDIMQLARIGCEESFADQLLEALEAEAIAPAWHVVRASDGTALACVLDDCDGADLQEAADRSLAVLAAEGPLPYAAWVARRGRHVFLLDRDRERQGIAFEGRTPISAETLEAGFGFRLPRE